MAYLSFCLTNQTVDWLKFDSEDETGLTLSGYEVLCTKCFELIIMTFAFWIFYDIDQILGVLAISS